MKPEVGCLVAFEELRNWRGYPLTGEIASVDGETFTISTFGRIGPGSEGSIHGVPLEAFRIIGWPEEDRP